MFSSLNHDTYADTFMFRTPFQMAIAFKVKDAEYIRSTNAVKTPDPKINV